MLCIFLCLNDRCGLFSTFVCVLLLDLEQVKNLHDYEKIIVLKYDVIRGSTFFLFIYGNIVGTSFPSQCIVLIGNLLVLVLEEKLVGANFLSYFFVGNMFTLVLRGNISGDSSISWYTVVVFNVYKGKLVVDNFPLGTVKMLQSMFWECICSNDFHG